MVGHWNMRGGSRAHARQWLGSSTRFWIVAAMMCLGAFLCMGAARVTAQKPAPVQPSHADVNKPAAAALTAVAAP